MNSPAPPPSAQVDPRRLLRDLSPYRAADTRRSLYELAVTALPFAALWAATVIALQAGHWLALALALPAGVFLLRLFLIQHDCGHGAFFPGRSANDWVGRVLGVLTLTPYEYWRRSHAAHHAGTSNLDARGLGDLDTLTVAEFRARGRAGRLAYRLYRHPFVLFGIGPAYVFLLKHRLPVGMTGRATWASAMGTNVAIALAAGAAGWLIGWQVLLLAHIPIVLVAATLGVWLFYVQHQFERTLWDRQAQWSFHEAALFGSSHYVLPTALRWLSANVGLHHVHHLASRIPFYRLDEAMRALPALRAIGRVGIAESLRSVRLVLWDEGKRRLVSFREARA
ncbi:fatty acid desaturase [Sphingomonas parva]|uniref:Fatty acid desaturase n=1 Tax=Sphingomonas parva TaxID=2555898 RepID=A0A4Y8ZNT8_9SPHN|nr:fatty acid desaturase [Sphingomonas parva]TFI57683.1 fatty acid desaturase [Sphingomonas parva]